MIRLLTICVALAAATPAGATEPAAVDRTELERLAERMDRAWTAADADANAELFAVDATARFAEDPLGQGREAIRGQFRSFFQGRPPGLRHVTKIERIEQLDTDLATWDAEVRVEQQQADKSWKTLTRIRNVTIAIREAGEWKIRTVRAFPVG